MVLIDDEDENYGSPHSNSNSNSSNRNGSQRKHSYASHQSTFKNFLRKTRRKSWRSFKALWPVGGQRRPLSLPVLSERLRGRCARRTKSFNSASSAAAVDFKSGSERLPRILASNASNTINTLNNQTPQRRQQQTQQQQQQKLENVGKTASCWARVRAAFAAHGRRRPSGRRTQTSSHNRSRSRSSSSSNHTSSSNSSRAQFGDGDMNVSATYSQQHHYHHQNNFNYNNSNNNSNSNNSNYNNNSNNYNNNSITRSNNGSYNRPQSQIRLCVRKRRLRRRRKRKLYIMPTTQHQQQQQKEEQEQQLRSTSIFGKAATFRCRTPSTASTATNINNTDFMHLQFDAFNAPHNKQNNNNIVTTTTFRSSRSTTTAAATATTTTTTAHRSTVRTAMHINRLSAYYATATLRLFLTTLTTLIASTTTTALSATKYSWIFLLIYLNLTAKVCLAGYHEKRLLHDLLDPYNTLERPVLNESDPLQLSFGLTLMQIIDVDEKNQLLVTNVWLKLEWNDMNLRWNTSDYGGVKDLRIPPHRIWKPDVLMYNSADEGFDGTYQTNVVVRNNGSCLYVPPGIFKSTCKIDITWFPFDDQRCEMKFGSWTYDGFQLDLQLQDETGGDISSYVLNGEWELLGVPGKRNEIYYNCCPEPYIDITFSIIIRRRTLYYFFNLIIPCVLIASMALLGFTLPPDSGEKLSLGVTILLSLTVFLNMVAETMPATSDAVPLLGTYFNCIMFMVASSVVSTILILNYHHRNADTHEMSEWQKKQHQQQQQQQQSSVAPQMRKVKFVLPTFRRYAEIRIVFLCWLPWILRMSRPGRPLILEFPTTPCSDTSSERKHQILSDVELKERSSKSLLANVLDIDDDFRHNCRPMTPGGTLPHNPAFYRTVYGQGDDGSIGPIGSTRMPDAVTHHTCIKSSTEYELGLILKEIRFITDQLRKEDEDNDIANDWKFAAMVVDRLCLIIFTMFTILATIAVLLSAPHIIVS